MPAKAFALAALVLILAGTLVHPAPLRLETRVWTEGAGETVELVVFPAGRGVAFDPSWPAKPLARVTGKPGSLLSLSVDAPLPLRVEVRAPEHVAMGLEVWLPQQLPLPEAWLSRGETKLLHPPSFGKASTVAVFSPLAQPTNLVTAALRWRPIVASQRLPAEKKVAVALPERIPVPLVALAEDGRWALANASLSEFHWIYASKPIRVRVVTEQGQPVAGAEVATQGGPLGSAVRTAEDGTAVVWQYSEKLTGVVAAQGALGATAVTRAAQVELVLKPVPAVRLVPAKPYGPLLVRTSGWPEALSGTFWVLPPEGGQVPNPGLEAALWVAAPGHCFATYPLEGDREELVVRLVSAASLKGRTLDPQGRPLAHVPIRVAAPNRAPLRPGIQEKGNDQGVLAVSDSLGQWQVAGLPPGEVWVQARWRQRVAKSPSLQLAAGEVGSLDLTLNPGVRLTATVQDQSGQPLSEVQVELYRLEEDETFSAFLAEREAPFAKGKSDTQGNVVITALPTGKFGLRLHRRGFVPCLLTVQLPASGLHLGVVTLEPGVEVAGRVVNERGEGVGQATVWLGSSPGANDLGWAQTDEHGFFSFSDQAVKGVVYLNAVGDDLIPGSPTKLDLPPAGPVELRVTTGLRLQGRVVDEASGGPVRGAQIQAGAPVPLVGAAWAFRRIYQDFAFTDDEGTFQLGGLSPGTVVIQVEAKGYIPVSRTVELEAGKEHRPLLIRLSKGLAISGRVYENSGEPAAGVWVSAEEASPQQAAATAKSSIYVSDLTDSGGYFQLSGLRPGTYQVQATGSSGERDRVLVAAGTTDVELRLGSLGELEVLVTDRQGVPVAHSRVVLAGGLHEEREGASEGTGRWRFSNLPPGSYWLEVQAEGFARAMEPVEVAGGKTVTRTVQLKPGGVVEGVVRGLTAEQLSQTEIRAFHGARTTVQADGRFRLEGVPLGKEPVAARFLGSGGTRTAVAEVEAGKPAFVEFDFSQSLTLRGRLQRASTPVTGFLVRARVENKASFAEDVTDQNGEFVLRELEAGRVRLTVVDPSGQIALLHSLDLVKDDRVELQLPTGTLAGRVTGQGEPISEATVTVNLGPGGYPERAARTLEDGSFSFRDLPPGRLRVTAVANGYAPSQREVELTESGSQTLELKLEPESALHVVVRDEDGSFPEAVSLLAVQPGSPPVWQWVELDRHGRGVVTSLPSGTYLGLWRSAGAAVASFSVPGRLNLQLQPAGKLEIAPEDGGEVLVVAADGTPLPPFSVPLATADGWTRLPAYFSPTLALPAGEYKVQLRRQGQLWQKSVQVRPNTVAVVSFKD